MVDMGRLIRNASIKVPVLVNEYRIYDRAGVYVCSKLRFEPKTFRYGRDGKPGRKPNGADSTLYVGGNRSMRDLLSALKSGRVTDVHWAEGEKDADALYSAGVAAVSCHQGACKATREQAALLLGAKRVVIWMDKDPAPHECIGAYDAAMRYDLLDDLGFTGDIVIVRARGKQNKDAYDHLQRHSLKRAIAVDLDWLVRTAAGYNPHTRGRYGY